MEEIEVPTEHLQEEIQHHAAHATGDSRWISRVALSSALFAVSAAVGSLMAGHHINEAMIEQLRASDHWAQYQAKSIKGLVSSMKPNLTSEDREKIAGYAEEQKEIAAEAKHEEAASHAHQAAHEVFARSVTFSQIAIAIGAIAVLSRRRKFWYVALIGGVIGVGFLAQGLLLR